MESPGEPIPHCPSPSQPRREGHAWADWFCRRPSPEGELAAIPRTELRRALGRQVVLPPLRTTRAAMGRGGEPMSRRESALVPDVARMDKVAMTELAGVRDGALFETAFRKSSDLMMI